MALSFRHLLLFRLFRLSIHQMKAAMSRDVVFDPGALSPRDLAALKKHRARLAALAESGRSDRGSAAPRMTVRLQDGDEQEDVALPPALAQAVAAALTEVADGHAMHAAPVAEELTTQQAADLLNVSRPFFVKLLERGTISYRKVGAHRRVQRADVLAYKAKMYHEAEAALQDLADQAQDLGLGYE